MRHSDTVNEQLQTALNSRVIIEQAKGKLAERLGLDMDQAFSVLRDHARTRNLRLSDVALAFIDGSETLHAQALLKSTPQGATDYLPADLRDPGVILRRAAEVLDFGQPAADRWDTRTRAAG
jgi:hypothetical protein